MSLVHSKYSRYSKRAYEHKQNTIRSQKTLMLQKTVIFVLSTRQLHEIVVFARKYVIFSVTVLHSEGISVKCQTPAFRHSVLHSKNVSGVWWGGHRGWGGGSRQGAKKCVNTVSLCLCLEYCQSCQSYQFDQLVTLYFETNTFNWKIK